MQGRISHRLSTVHHTTIVGSHDACSKTIQHLPCLYQTLHTHACNNQQLPSYTFTTCNSELL